MTKRMPYAALLLFAALAPMEGRAAEVDVSDVTIDAFTRYTTQLAPERTDFDTKTVPLSSLFEANALNRAPPGVPFPNVPNRVGQAFASSAVDASGSFGVGVNGFFFKGALPPNALQASGHFDLTFTNRSTTAVPLAVGFFIPAPTMRFFEIGNSFPAGADPNLDAHADLDVRLFITITHPDGSVVTTIALDYGMTTFRDPVSGVFFAVPHRDGRDLTRFDEPDGSFGFRLPELRVDSFVLPDIGAGDIYEFGYEYFASASTGFGETGIFAAIGDPFDLSAGGGRFDLRVGDAVGPGPGSGVPEPDTLATLGLGLFVLGISARGRPPRPLCNRS